MSIEPAPPAPADRHGRSRWGRNLTLTLALALTLLVAIRIGMVVGHLTTAVLTSVDRTCEGAKPDRPKTPKDAPSPQSGERAVSAGRHE